MPDPGAVPAHLVGVLDDAGALTPDRRTRETAVPADLVATCLVDDARLPEVTADPALPAVTVVVSGGAGALAPAVAWAVRAGLRLVGLEVTMRQSDAGDLASNARRLVAAVDDLQAGGVLDEDVAVHLRPPPLDGAGPTASWLGALDEVATRDHLLTFGGSGTGASLPSAQLAAGIEAALDRELRFACGTGAHPLRAVTRAPVGRDPAAPGLLNLLAATRAALDGAARAEVTRVLDERDAATLLAAVDDAGLASARRWCVSVRTVDLPMVWTDLVQSGLSTPRPG
ncbi:MAG: hypothetical protein WB441_00335 [Nocardioidaceae bacterium]